jgi:hypothetical protein
MLIPPFCYKLVAKLILIPPFYYEFVTNLMLVPLPLEVLNLLHVTLFPIVSLYNE